MKPLFLIITVCVLSCTPTRKTMTASPEILRTQVLDKAASAMLQQPITVTSSYCERSAGGKHEFYSEGDYWWPNPVSIDSPYIQRDGLSNPSNFVAHRLAMIRFSEAIGALAAAYKLTHDDKYALQAFKHCDAWFVDTSTKMSPNLLYAQAIKGRATGRGIGIIDAIHLVEVAQGLRCIENIRGNMDKDRMSGYKKWFGEYLQWVTTHKYGRDEMNAENNHGTCWAMQVAVFARFTGDKELMQFCRDRYKQVLLPGQMAADGSFPRELRRTKPYGYSIFNLDAMTTICQVLSTGDDDLWKYKTSDGRSIKKGIEFLYPFIVDKGKWPLKPDVMYWDNWPVAPPFMLFGSIAFSNKGWFETWRKLDHNPTNEEVIRNLPVRNPLLWTE